MPFLVDVCKKCDVVNFKTAKLQKDLEKSLD